MGFKQVAFCNTALKVRLCHPWNSTQLNWPQLKATESSVTESNWPQLKATESTATESNWLQLKATESSVTESNWPQLKATERNWKQLVAKSTMRDFPLRVWLSKVYRRTPTRRALLGYNRLPVFGSQLFSCSQLRYSQLLSVAHSSFQLNWVEFQGRHKRTFTHFMIEF